MLHLKSIESPLQMECRYVWQSERQWPSIFLTLTRKFALASIVPSMNCSNLGEDSKIIHPTRRATSSPSSRVTRMAKL